jgi:polar amino acid transport system substrate-binding protein
MRVRLGIVLVLVALVAAACGGDDEPTAGGEGCGIGEMNLVEPGVLTIATGEPAFPPWIVDDDPTNKQGFEGAIAYAVAGKLGFADSQVKWVRTDFFEAISVGPKPFDFNLQQYSIRADRDEQVDFSRPYYTTAQAVVAFADNAVTAASTIDDLKDYKLGAQLGTTSLAYIENIIEPDSDAAVYDTGVDAKAGLDALQVDALLFDLPTAFYITAVEIPDATIVGVLPAEEDAAENLGLLMEEGNSLKTCVDDALDQLDNEGVLLSLASQWLEQASDLKNITK